MIKIIDLKDLDNIVFLKTFKDDKINIKKKAKKLLSKMS